MRDQMKRAESALEALRHEVLPKSEHMYQLMSEAYLDTIMELRGKIDAYLEINHEINGCNNGVVTDPVSLVVDCQSVIVGVSLMCECDNNFDNGTYDNTIASLRREVADLTTKLETQRAQSTSVLIEVYDWTKRVVNDNPYTGSGISIELRDLDGKLLTSRFVLDGDVAIRLGKLIQEEIITTIDYRKAAISDLLSKHVTEFGNLR